MFQMIELLCDIYNLRQAGLTEDEIGIYLELLFEKNKAKNTEVV